MAEYAVTISFAFENEDVQSIVLDTIDDTQVSASSRITEHPVASGEFVADHMYKEPVTMTIRGTLSLNGGQAFVISKSGGKLADAQELFERIKNEGVLCNIVKVKIAENNAPLFLSRSNMALNQIAWVEKINSLDFTFNFRQVLTVDVEQYDVDLSDQYLPSITEPKTLSFTDMLLDWDIVDQTLISTMHDLGLITDEFLQYYLSNATSGLLIGLGVGAVAASIAAKIATIIGASFATGTLLIVGVAAGIGLIAGMIVGICKSIEKNKYRVKAFEKYESDKKNQQEVVRFANFIGEVHQSFEELNSSILLYQISSNEEQECMLSLGGNYYTFKFTKNNTSGKYGLKVFDLEDAEVTVLEDISGALTSYMDCNTQNELFRAYETGEYVYLMNLSEETTDLSTYCILSSKINPEDFTSLVQELIKNALYK